MSTFSNAHGNKIEKSRRLHIYQKLWILKYSILQKIIFSMPGQKKVKPQIIFKLSNTLGERKGKVFTEVLGTKY